MELKINEGKKKEYIEKGYWSTETIADYWKNISRKYADKEYVVDDRGYRYTYEQIDEDSSKLAAYLQSLGIGSHDVVSFQIPVWSEFVIVAIACFKLGAVLQPIAMFYEKCELIRALNISEAKVYVGTTFFHKTDYESRIMEVKHDIPSLSHIILLDNLSAKKSDYVTLKEILCTYQPDYIENDDVNGFDVTLLLSTSGTTGGSKGVMLTHNNILYSELEFNKELGLDCEDVMFMASPLNHATGFHHGIISPMLTGAKVVLQQKYNASLAIELINKEQCTYSMGATPFIYDLIKEMKATGKRVDSLSLYLCGGAPVPDYMVQEAYRFGIILSEVYGSTESVPHAFVRPDEVLELNGSTSGRAIEGVEIRVVDEQGKDVCYGVMGEAISRGPNVFVGYIKNPEATEKVLDDEGWFYSGDYCTMDAAGNIRIIGRKKDMILRGGENLDSNEIDTYIEGCPGVEDHTVIGMPDDRLGERICAYIKATDETEPPTVESIAAYMKAQGRPKRFWPERVEIIENIPRTHSGKVKKYLLQEDIKAKLEGN